VLETRKHGQSKKNGKTAQAGANVPVK